MTHISYQLYCSRNFPPLGDTLQMLSAAGYKEVEGYGGILDDVDGLKAALDKNGLAMTTCHMGLDAVMDDGATALATAKTLGMKAVFVPHVAVENRPADARGWVAFGKKLAEAGKPFLDAGIAFGWHNHDFEFVKTPTDHTPLDLIFDATPDLKHELDLGWVTRAGEDPVAWINKYAGRLAAVHVKDIAPAGECTDEDGWADVGHGTADWAAIHAALQNTGVSHYVIEHDNPKDHARFATRSYDSVAAF
jgi:sugar phosphate isomerase/epimerase